MQPWQWNWCISFSSIASLPLVRYPFTPRWWEVIIHNSLDRELNPHSVMTSELEFNALDRSATTQNETYQLAFVRYGGHYRSALFSLGDICTCTQIYPNLIVLQQCARHISERLINFTLIQNFKLVWTWAYMYSHEQFVNFTSYCANLPICVS